MTTKASRWAPLESNPEVLTHWAGLVGLSTKRYAFSDVYGLDDEMLSLVPQPVKAVLLVFPLTDEIDSQRKQTDIQVQKDGQPNLDPTVFFIKQTISNACGTIALLHSIYNTNVTMEPTSALQKFQQQAMGEPPHSSSGDPPQPLTTSLFSPDASNSEMTPDERAKLLETTDLFATAHASAASGGQSNMPANLSTNEHFVAFVQAPNPENPDEQRLIELDGRRPAPLDLGVSTDLLKDAAKIVKTKYVDLANTPSFAVITLGPKWE